jgi:hypothetical protein
MTPGLKLTLIGLFTTISLAVSALVSTTAQAATGYGRYSVVGTGSSGLNERSAPSTSAGSLGKLPNGTTIYIACQTAGGAYSTGGSPASDSIWDQLTSGAYVADYWVSTPAVGTFSSSIPRCGATSPTPTPTPTPAASYTKLQNAASARCLDADMATIGATGTKVQLWDCWGGTNQNWSIGADGTIRNQASGRCLDADMNTIGANGTIVHLWDCNGQANQRWTTAPDGTIRNQASGRCLDADMGTIPANGTKMQLWDCNGGHNQSWNRFAPNSPTPYLCYSYHTGWPRVDFSFGLTATICYNGSAVYPGRGTWVTPSCVAASPGYCSTGLQDYTGGGVEGTIAVNSSYEVAVPAIPLVGVADPLSIWAEYSTLSWIKVTKNGQATGSSDPGPPTYVVGL